MREKVSLRLAVVCFCIIGAAVFIISKLFFLQVISSSSYKERAENQHTALVGLSGKRGDIRDSNGGVLAKSLPSYSLYAVSEKIKNEEEVARKLAPIISVDKKTIEKKLRKDFHFVWLKRELSNIKKDAVKDLDIDHLGFVKEFKRIYPQQDFFSHILGIVNIDGKGLEGIELQYNEFLEATEGKVSVLKDSRGRILPLYKEVVPSKDGFNIVLTIDSSIQYWVENFLKETVKNSKAKGGSVIVMNPDNGKIYALANRPAFDPNEISSFPVRNRRNRAVTDFYEPGSVFKVVTLVSALAEKPGLVNKTIFCENGAYKIPGTVLHDWKDFGNLKFEDVFKNSSNIGVAKIANVLGSDVIYEYMKKMGFGEKTGIDLPGETSGFVKPTSNWSNTSRYIIPIGQEVCVSLLQLVKAFGEVANGGYEVQPHIVDKIVDNEGVIVQDLKVDKNKRVLPSKAVRKVKKILSKVVSDGSGRRAKLKKVKVGGKTGTAQKIKPGGGYSHTDFYASFIGFFPVQEPKYVMGVVIDEPRTYYYGGMIAAPLFKKIAEKIVEYKGVGD